MKSAFIFVGNSIKKELIPWKLLKHMDNRNQITQTQDKGQPEIKIRIAVELVASGSVLHAWGSLLWGSSLFLQHLISHIIPQRKILSARSAQIS